MYLAEDRWRSAGVRDKTRVDFYSGLPVIFGAPVFAKSLTQVCEERSLNTHFKHDLREVRGHSGEAVFVNLDTGKELVEKFDFLHAVPPMSAPDYIKASPLAAPTGFLSVNQETLQNDKFKNVFSIGDSSSLPTSKTAAAVSSQARVLVQNMLDHMMGRSLSLKYDGYTSCPLPTEIGLWARGGGLRGTGRVRVREREEKNVQSRILFALTFFAMFGSCFVLPLSQASCCSPSLTTPSPRTRPSPWTRPSRGRKCTTSRFAHKQRGWVLRRQGPSIDITIPSPPAALSSHCRNMQCPPSTGTRSSRASGWAQSRCPATSSSTSWACTEFSGSKITSCSRSARRQSCSCLP